MKPCKYCGYEQPGFPELCYHCRAKDLYKLEFIPDATITINDVCNTKATYDEFTRFYEYYNRCGFMRNEPIPVDENMISYCHDKCFINWLIKIGKLKKIEKFEPTNIVITVTSKLQYWNLWHRLNAGHAELNHYKKTTTTADISAGEALESKTQYDLFVQVNERRKKLNG